MSSREYVDSSGRVWRVWSTVPNESRVLAASHAGGWLTFECDDCVRRFAPIPRDWESLRPQQLEYLCLCATETTRRMGPLPRMPRPAADDSQPASQPSL